MTKGSHDAITELFSRNFNEEWGKNRWVVAASASNIYIQAQLGRRSTYHKPDIAVWGYHKCTKSKRRGTLVAQKKDPKPPGEQNEPVNPDVVFQFSWGDKMGYDVEAMNEMMNRALVLPFQPNNEALRLGFLVKVWTKKKRNCNGRKILSGVDLYRVPKGTAAADAKANRNGASHVSYTSGGAVITFEITA